MGKWKKAVAALAAVPMLMALAPAANAVESDPITPEILRKLVEGLR